jgi:hypothetical protein
MTPEQKQAMTETARSAGDDRIGLIVYCASMVVRAWDDAVEAQRRAKGAVGPEQQEAAAADVHKHLIILNLAQTVLRQAFLAPLPSDGGG